jgi:hypothetical protein
MPRQFHISLGLRPLASTLLVPLSQATAVAVSFSGTELTSSTPSERKAAPGGKADQVSTLLLLRLPRYSAHPRRGGHVSWPDFITGAVLSVSYSGLRVLSIKGLGVGDAVALTTIAKRGRLVCDHDAHMCLRGLVGNWFCDTAERWVFISRDTGRT